MTEEINAPVLKRDKIFENKYEESEADKYPTEFKIDPSDERSSFDLNIDELIISEKVTEIIESYPLLKKLMQADEFGEFSKITKIDANLIYSHIITSLPDSPRIEIFSVVSSLFDLSSERFYEYLSNTFKTELINELKDRGYLGKSKSLF